MQTRRGVLPCEAQKTQKAQRVWTTPVVLFRGHTTRLHPALVVV